MHAASRVAQRPFSIGRRTAIGAAVVGLSLLGARDGGAQGLTLKRTFPSATAGICPRFPTPAPATAPRVQESRRLFSLGQEASIVGDHRAARDLFRQAVALNGSDERLAYYLARSNEELKLAPEAVAEYCRYLALAPTGTDAADVRTRLERLTETPATRIAGVSGRRTTAAARFQSGIEAADRGQLAESEKAFGDAIAQLPEAAEAYFDRGVVRVRRRDWSGAERDFDRYLSLRPTAEDAADVRERVRVLRRAATSPGTALAGGLVLPGFAQYYTRRPVFGALVTTAAVGGLVYALRETDRTKDTTFTDDFGNPYPGTVTYRGRYGQSTGLAVAGGALLAGALEGYLHASATRREAVRLVALGEGEEGRRFGAALRPAWVTASDGSRRRGLALQARLRF